MCGAEGRRVSRAGDDEVNLVETPFPSSYDPDVTPDGEEKTNDDSSEIFEGDIDDENQTTA